MSWRGVLAVVAAVLFFYSILIVGLVAIGQITFTGAWAS